LQANFWFEVDGRRKFDIDIFGLRSGQSEYNFTIDDTFFQNFENSIIEKGSLTCHVILEKTERLITVNFEITGKVELICDRSLELFNHFVNINDQIIFKYGTEEKELDNNIYSIASSTQKLKLSQPIFELITVTVPMKRLHPRFSQDNEENEDEFIYSSENKSKSFQNTENSTGEAIDPRWEILKKFKDNKK
jgi:uncharacterized metal-binding protein YceD (DUF177 family)